MTARLRVAIAGAAFLVVAAILAQNLFGRELNAFFLDYPGIDKALHVIEYAGVFTIARLVAAAAGLARNRQAAVALIATVAIAALDESVQTLAPGRSVEVLDFAANLAGAGLGLAAMLARTRRIVVATCAVAASTALILHTHVTLRDFSRGLKHERAREFGQARHYYLRALEAGVRTPGLFNSLGWVEVESGEGDPARAVEYAATALAMRPDDPDILDTYGWALHHAGRHRDALEPLQRAYAGKPNMYCINYHLGEVYRALGRDDLAERHFHQQLQLTRTREARLAARALETLQRQRNP